jgi:hypothetical protein
MINSIEYDEQDIPDEIEDEEDDDDNDENEDDYFNNEFAQSMPA